MKSTVLVELRAAEGGDHAKRLIVDQFRVYVKVAERRGL
jgi:protein subunit release factor A